MKNLFKTMMLVAVAAMGFTACSKEDVTEAAAPVKQGKKITIVGDITRTEFTDDRSKLVWSEGDTFAIFTDMDDNNILTSEYSADATSFGFKATVDPDAEYVYAYYPYDDYNNARTASNVSVTVERNQTQSVSGQLDKNMLPMVAQGEIVNDVVSLSFRPVACVLALNIYGGTSSTEQVTSVMISSTTKISGYSNMDLIDPEAEYAGYNTDATVALAEEARFVPNDTKPADASQFAHTVYLVVAKAEYPAGTKFEVKTTEASYTFTSTGVIDCTDTYRTMNLNLAKAEKLEQATLAEGDYVVMVNYNDTFYAMSSKDATSANRRASVVITDYTAGAASYSTTNDYIIWNLCSADGGFYLMHGDQYLAGTNNLNYAKVGTATDVIKISENENGSYTLFSSNNTTDARVLALNGDVNDTQEFSFYKETTVTYSTYSAEIYLIPAIYVATPIIEVANTEIALVNTASENNTLSFISKNMGTATVTAESSAEWLTVVSCTNELLTYSVEANPGEEREATITLSAQGAEPVVINFTQAKYVDASQSVTEEQNVYANKGSLSGKVITWDFENFTLKNEQDKSSTAIRNSDSDHFRAYQGSKLTFTAKNDKTITKIVITCTSSSYASAMKNSLGESATISDSIVTWVGSATEVSCSMTAQSRFNKVEVTLN